MGGQGLTKRLELLEIECPAAIGVDNLEVVSRAWGSNVSLNDNFFSLVFFSSSATGSNTTSMATLELINTPSLCRGLRCVVAAVRSNVLKHCSTVNGSDPHVLRR